MQLIALELDNFRQHAHTELRFEHGVTGIIGPNGSGKTTILESLAWALYGSPAIRGANHTIRRRGSEGGVKPQVRLTFSLGEHTYVVTRSLDRASLEIDGIAARTGLAEVTSAVTRLLKMDYRAFFTSFFTEQKQLTFMAGMDGRQKAAAVSRMLGYDRLTKARDKAIEDRRGLDREITGLEHGLGNPEVIRQRKIAAKAAVAAARKHVEEAEARCATFKQQLAGLRPRKEQSDRSAEKHEKLTRQIELDRSRQTAAEERLREVEKSLAEIAAMEQELESLTPALHEFASVEAEYRRLQDLQQHELEKQRLQGQLSGVADDCAKLEERIRQLTGARKVHQNADANVSELEKRLQDAGRAVETARSEWTARQASATARIQGLRQQRENVSIKRREIEAAGPDGKCPTCERELCGDLPIVIASFDKQLQDIDSQIGILQRELTALQTEPKELSDLVAQKAEQEQRLAAARTAREAADRDVRNLDSAQKELAGKCATEASLKEALKKLPAGFDQEKLQKALDRGRKLRPLKDRSIRLQAEIERKSGLNKELTQLRDSVQSMLKRIEVGETALREIAFSPQERAALVAEYEATTVLSTEADLDAERRRGDARAALAELAAVESEGKAYKEKQAELTRKRTERLYLNTLSDGFDGLRVELDGRTRPELEATAGELLAEMTDGRYNVLEINDAYEATIRDDGELMPVISGGEDDIVNLALRLAISQMIADRAGQSFSLLILDEVFGSLDDSRRANVVEMLMNLKNRFQQIIVITHIESIHDALDSAMWVEYDEAQKLSRIAEKRMEVPVEI